ncbi:7-methylguanosine phosphate-specific 5'-nucleotidase isoform X7 [Macaca fascicularis]|uniref:7-methylguanosine phosphate-specific 5'-nucleotidase isoform X7 n=1 Tax=Macaca fascicularis TaxID=9541 RepID=UPI003D1566F7
MAEEVSTLMKATVLMRQPGRVQEIVGVLRKGGGERLQVISDFDMTLSRFAYNGKRCPSSYNILDNSKIISEECRKELTALLHHYYPIEIDPHRTIKEKLPHMVEWWTKAHNLLCQQKIQKFQIAQVVRESSAMLRVFSRDLRASSYTHTTRTAPCVRTLVTSSNLRAKPMSSCWETPSGTSPWPMGFLVCRTFSRLAS